MCASQLNARWADIAGSTMNVTRQLIVVAGLTLSPLLSYGSDGTTPGALEAAVQKRGANAVMADLRADHQAWSEVLAGIESGHPAWLAIGTQLRSAAGDGGRGYTLDRAFGNAITAAPSAVLEFAPHLKRSCGNLNDTYLLGEPEIAFLEVERRLDAVRGVDDARLAGRKAACLAALGELRETGLPGWFDVQGP